MNDFLGMHNAAGTALQNRLWPVMSIRTTVPVPAPNTWSTVPRAGTLNGVTRIVYGAGRGALDESADNYGIVVCIETDGTPVWTYESANDDVIMGVWIDDIDGDGVNEVLVATRLKDHNVIVLNQDGEFQWSYDIGVADVYLRPVVSGELQSGSSGKEVVTGGRFGQLALVDNAGDEIWKVTLTDPYYSTVQSARIADTDSDGQAEILVSCGVAIRKHRASDGAEIWATVIGAEDSYSYGLDVGKITANDGLQIAAATQNHGIHVLDQAGNILWSASGGVGLDWTVHLGDVNGDGYTEVFVGHGGSSGGGVRLLSSAGQLMSKLALPAAVKFMHYYDVDGDGVGELIAACDDGNLYICNIAI